MDEQQETVPSAWHRERKTDSNLMKALYIFDENIERYIIITAYVFISFIILFNILQRFVLQTSSQWAIEIAIRLFLYLIWFGASLAVRERQHIRIDLIYGYLSDRNVALLYVLSDIMVVIFAGIIIFSYYPILETAFRFGPTILGIDLAQYWFQVSVPLGVGLMAFRGLQATYWDIVDIRNGRSIWRGAPLFAEEGDMEPEEIDQ